MMMTRTVLALGVMVLASLAHAWTQKDSARIYAPEASQAVPEQSADAARAKAEAKAAAIHDTFDRCHAISGTGIYGPADTMSFAEWNYRGQIYLACLSAAQAVEPGSIFDTPGNWSPKTWAGVCAVCGPQFPNNACRPALKDACTSRERAIKDLEPKAAK